jgi:hypothetical protein
MLSTTRTRTASAAYSAWGRDKVDCGPGSGDAAYVNANDDVRRCDGNMTVV